MNYLLDTHTLIWALTDPSKLSKNVRNILENPGNEVCVSTITFWEISLKYSLGKLSLGGLKPDDFPGACKETSFRVVNLSEVEASSYHNLTAQHHKDPFDRMLIWQALHHGYTFISDDSNVRAYKSEGLKVLW